MILVQLVLLVLLVLGVFALIRYPRLRKVKAVDYPEVDAAAFEGWLAAERRAAMWFIVATIGVFVVQAVLGMGMLIAVLRASPAQREAAQVWYLVGSVVTFLVLLSIAGSRAAKLK